jgi:putative phage-type endonuclease
MIVHDLVPGTPEWHSFRSKHFNASDAAAMMGVSPYETRNQLLQRLHLGIDKEPSAFLQELYDKGHEFEALAMPLAEEIIGAELFPVVGSNEHNEKIAASFDGLTMFEDTSWEHKKLNAALRSCKTAEDLPLFYRIQMEQQQIVSEKTKKTLFMASDWEDKALIEEKHFWYYPDLKLRMEILAAWEQFEKDLANYKYEEPQAKVIGCAPDALPALMIEMRGDVVASNLNEFKTHALAVLNDIKTDLETDEDFASADKTAKWCKDIEARLDAAKDHALAQTQSIDEIFRAIDSIKEETRRKRLTLEKLVAQQKENIRAKKVLQTQNAYLAHIQDLGFQKLCTQFSLKTEFLSEVLFKPDFGRSIKGLRTLTSIQNALDTILAQEKIAANNLFKQIQSKLNIFETEAKTYEYLFPDLSTLLNKSADDFLLTIKHRIEQSRKKDNIEVHITPRVREITPAKEQEITIADTDALIVEQFIKSREYGDKTELIRMVLTDFCCFLYFRKSRIGDLKNVGTV